MASRKSRRQEREEQGFRSFERAGAAYPDAASPPLPRAQERVQQAIERDALLPTRRRSPRGVWGDTPRQAEPAAGRWRPGAYRPDRKARGVFTPLPVQRASAPYKRLSDKKSGYAILRQLSYLNPERVLVCARRAVRREVLFALGIGGHRRRSPGRGGGYRRTEESNWRC